MGFQQAVHPLGVGSDFGSGPGSLPVTFLWNRNDRVPPFLTGPQVSPFRSLYSVSGVDISLESQLTVRNEAKEASTAIS